MCYAMLRIFIQDSQWGSYGEGPSAFNSLLDTGVANTTSTH